MTTSPTRILVTDDDTLTLSAVTRVLTSAGYDVISAINGEQTLQMVEEHHPDLMLLDVVLPDIAGTEICRRIKADPRTADIFIILLSGMRTSSDEQSQGMEGGADGYIARPIANRELLARIQAYLRVKIAEQRLREYARHLEEVVKELKHVEVELRQAKGELETSNLELQQSLTREKLVARTDGLTSLCNHRHFFELAAREFHAAVRYRYPLTFIMFDMDNFKQINDTFGHSMGDKFLVMAAHTAAAQVRASDVVSRYGGDEFIIMLPHTSAQQSLPVAERIRVKAAAVCLDALRDDKESFAATISIGIAETRYEPMDENIERVIQRADAAMYEAKQSGRNRIVIFDQDKTKVSGDIPKNFPETQCVLPAKDKPSARTR
jgi:diguanylate cyclase (GGDEF)-like protein